MDYHSERFDDDFIVENATKYPWDFESLSANRSIDFVKRIIVIPELHNDTVDWDWETLMPQMEDEFVLQYIDTIPFVMYSQTENTYLYIPNLYAFIQNASGTGNSCR